MGALAGASQDPEAAWLAPLFGVAAVVVFPILYGLMAFVMGLAVLHLRGTYFAVLTFGMTELIRHAVTYFEKSVTGTVGRVLTVVPERDTVYLTVLLLSRVIVSLGTLPQVDTWVVENLFAADLAFLQDLYRRINQEGHTRAAVTCPSCSHSFTVDVAGGASGGQ